MPMKLSTRKSRLRAALILSILALLGGLVIAATARETLWMYLCLIFALLVCVAALVVLGGIAGSPRFRRTRAFNPSKRLLKKVEVKKQPPSSPPPPPSWPSPNLDDVPSDAPFGIPPVTNEASYDEPFDTQVTQLLVTITTDEPVLTVSFGVAVPSGAPANSFIEELDVLVMDRGAGLKAKAWVYYGSDANDPLVQSPIVTADFS